jgi:hypothetical protein
MRNNFFGSFLVGAGIGMMGGVLLTQLLDRYQKNNGQITSVQPSFNMNPGEIADLAKQFLDEETKKKPENPPLH